MFHIYRSYSVAWELEICEISELGQSELIYYIVSINISQILITLIHRVLISFILTPIHSLRYVSQAPLEKLLIPGLRNTTWRPHDFT